MPAASDSLFTFPSFATNNPKAFTKPELHLDLDLSPDEDDIFTDHLNMASPFIKDEPEDHFLHNNNHDTDRFNMTFHGHGGSGNYDNSHNFNHQSFDGHGINPDALHMGSMGGQPNGNSHNGASFNGFPHQMGGGNNNANVNFAQGASALDDDELRSTLDDAAQQNFGMHQNDQAFNTGSQPIAMSRNGFSMQGQQMSHTPHGNPIQSPFVNSYDYGSMNNGRIPFVPQPFSANAVPIRGSVPHVMERQHSDSRSPVNASAARINTMHIGSTPESGSYRGINPLQHHRNQQSYGSNPVFTPGTSYINSPQLQSPGMPDMDMISARHASMPTTNGERNGTALSSQQDAKRKKRRESHNAVERRRRDNINERIHDLSKLVPGHRLEDEKVRKHLHNNGPLSPSIAENASPSAALLAGGSGRRGAGAITTGLPLDEKDKGPNKGDILNGAVGWTRDLMWMLHQQIQREDELRDMLSRSGHEWPFTRSVEEDRMISEIVSAIERNDADTFSYSRGPGSGLRVPGHTTLAGDPLNAGSTNADSSANGASPNSPGANNDHDQSGYNWNNSQSFEDRLRDLPEEIDGVEDMDF